MEKLPPATRIVKDWLAYFTSTNSAGSSRADDTLSRVRSTPALSTPRGTQARLPLPAATAATTQVAAAKISRLPQLPEGVSRLVPSPGGHFTAALEDDGTLRINDTAILGPKLEYGGHATQASWLRPRDPDSPDAFLLCQLRGGGVAVVDAARGKQLLNLPQKFIVKVEVSNASNLVAVSCDKGYRLSVLDALSGKVTHNIRYPISISALSWSPDDTTLAVGLAGKQRAYILGLDGSQRSVPYNDYSSPLVFSPDSSRLAVVHPDSYVVWYDAHQGNVARDFKDYKSVRAMQWSPSGARFAIASGATLHVIKTDGEEVIHTHTSKGPVTGLTWNGEDRLEVERDDGHTEQVTLNLLARRLSPWARGAASTDLG